MGKKTIWKDVDNEQAQAIASTKKNILVTARAGSGKTSTLINRVLFLLLHLNIKPSEILILAFNTKAKLEVYQRILFILSADCEKYYREHIDEAKKASRTKKDEIEIEENLLMEAARKYKIAVPYVLTFHALSHAFVKPKENLIFNNYDADQMAHNEFLQSIINEMIPRSR